MPDVYIDFETRSFLDLNKVGSWKYAGHESTLPLMLAALLSDDMVQQWVFHRDGKQCPNWLLSLIADSETIFHAWNAGFEFAIWESICVRQWQWPTIPISRWRCTAARAAYANQPRGLSAACKQLRVSERKDDYGKFLIDKLSMPQRAVKTRKYTNDQIDKRYKKGDIRPDSFGYLQENGIPIFDAPYQSKGRTVYYPSFWYNDPGLMAQFTKYNRQDVLAERDVDRALPELPKDEQHLWELDVIINWRGLPIDLELCEAVNEVYKTECEICNRQIRELTAEPNTPVKLIVERHTQGKRIKHWINKRVNFGDSLAVEIVDEWLRKPWGVDDPDEAEKVRQVLKLSKIAGGSGVKKYFAALDWTQDDGRARGQLLYFGAKPTGRWTGKGIQPQNMVRQAIPDELFFDAIKTGDHATVQHIVDAFDMGSVNGLLRQCVRGMIRAPEGQQLVVSDFAGIESRVLQWLAGNDEVCQRFLDPTYDNYVDTASGIFEIPYSEMMEKDGDGLSCKKEYKDKRQVGKICVLALGYGMGAGKYQATCENFGVEMEASFAEDIVTKWRGANPLVVELWRRIERAARHVIKNKRAVAYIDDKLRVSWDPRGYLMIRLPSGRVMYYFRARLVRGDMGPTIWYTDSNKGDVSTYGGCLVENAVQAISRDLLCHSMFLANARGLEIIGHVHDELIVLAKADDHEAKQKLHNCMTHVPVWGQGVPLAAETYTGQRYTK